VKGRDPGRILLVDPGHTFKASRRDQSGVRAETEQVHVLRCLRYVVQRATRPSDADPGHHQALRLPARAHHHRPRRAPINRYSDRWPTEVAYEKKASNSPASATPATAPQSTRAHRPLPVPDHDPHDPLVRALEGTTPPTSTSTAPAPLVRPRPTRSPVTGPPASSEPLRHSATASVFAGGGQSRRLVAATAKVSCSDGWSAWSATVQEKLYSLVRIICNVLGQTQPSTSRP
jgi:hypothetical protein